jgi:hypothetical protein
MAYNCRLCDRLIISQAVTFTAPNLIINLPAGSYQNCERYCIVVAQAIPDATTINAPVFITIGDGTELYPLNQCNGVQATASGIRTRTRYATKVTTTATGGAFRLLGKICCYPTDSLTSIDGTAPAAAPGGGGGA